MSMLKIAVNGDYQILSLNLLKKKKKKKMKCKFFD